MPASYQPCCPQNHLLEGCLPPLLPSRAQSTGTSVAAAAETAAAAVRAAAARGDVDEVLRLIDCGARPALYSPPSQTREPANKLPAERSLEQLREFAAKISELNLKRVCEYKPEVMNPEELFEPRPSPKVTLESLTESHTPPLVDSESTS